MPASENKIINNENANIGWFLESPERSSIFSKYSSFLRSINRQLKKYVFSDTLHTLVVKNFHGDSGGVRGAAWL